MGLTKHYFGYTSESIFHILWFFDFLSGGIINFWSIRQNQSFHILWFVDLFHLSLFIIFLILLLFSTMGKDMYTCIVAILEWLAFEKNSTIKAKMLKTEGLTKNKIVYMKHIKIHWFHMDVIFMPKHLIWKRLQCAHILILIMHFHTGNMYYGAMPNFHVSILLTKKHIKSMKK